jgi:hypothetical protein
MGLGHDGPLENVPPCAPGRGLCSLIIIIIAYGRLIGMSGEIMRWLGVE